MTTLNSLIQEYLSEEEKNILNILYPKNNNKDEEISLEEKNKFFLEFINGEFLKKYFIIITNKAYNIIGEDVNFPAYIGSGTQGIVFSLILSNLDIVNSKLIDVYNKKRCKENIVNQEVACKIQLINNPKEKYWESRMLREETIMMKLNTFETIKKYIPKIYLGFTIIFNGNKFRITLMELFKPGRFENIQTILNQLSNEKADIIIAATKPLIYSLWRNGISHNDISIRNILVDLFDLNNIKLIDFGLETMFKVPNTLLESNNSRIETEYINYFSDKTKEEQHGSNVIKLNEFIDILKQRM